MKIYLHKHLTHEYFHTRNFQIYDNSSMQHHNTCPELTIACCVFVCIEWPVHLGIFM